MKKLILTSTRFTGQVIIVYGIDMKLLQIDMSAAELDELQTRVMKARAPVYYDEKTFLQLFESETKSLTFIEEDFEVTFEMWFDDYNVKRNKVRCLGYWNKFSKADRAKAWFGNKPYDRHLQLNPWKTKAEPDTYLKNRYFDNDYSK